METETITKSKRIKKVFGNISDIVHLWAHEKQDEARCRNVFFEGEVIYSYGRHFPIARIYTQNRGKKNEKKTVFFTTRTWGTTTGQHISSVRQACKHMDILYMKDPITGNDETGKVTWKWYQHGENLRDFAANIKLALDNIPSAREMKKSYLHEARSEAGMLRKYIDFFKMRTHLPKEIKDILKRVDDTKWDDQIKEFEEKKAARLSDPLLEEKREKARIAREKSLEKKFAEQIQKWRNFEAYKPYVLPGKSIYRNHNCNLPDLLRYNSEKERIETSQGVQVPVEAAHRLYRQIKVVLSRGSCITEDACAEKILDYSVREITTEHLKVGCHTIKMTEIEEMAKQLKWND